MKSVFTDPHSDQLDVALWLSVQKVYEPAALLADLGAVLGTPNASQLTSYLTMAVAGTPLTGRECMVSREKFVSDFVESRVGDRPTIRSIMKDGVWHDAPLYQKAGSKYREYLANVSRKSLDTARVICTTALCIESAADSTLLHRVGATGALKQLLFKAQGLKLAVRESFVHVQEPFQKMAKRLQRIDALERLGRGTSS